MAFASMMFAGIIIAVIILGIMFIVGMILLIAGIVNKRREKNKGRKFPVVLIVSGIVFLISPVFVAGGLLVTGVTSAISHEIESAEHECVPDEWRSSRLIGDNKAASDVITALLESADAGDKEAFIKNFTPNIQKRADFNSDVDAFFSAYPGGFSTVELEGGLVQSSSSSNEGELEKHGNTRYTCRINGEWYAIYLRFCHGNTLYPDEVGVTGFFIENLETNALDMDYENEFLSCILTDESKVCARLISNRSFVFTPYPDRIITFEEMQQLLSEHGSLASLSEEIGPPNVTIKYSNCTGWDHYYELAPENGEPRYAYLCTNGEHGGILYGYLESETKTLYDYDMIPGER